jgi:hypothetical protein
MLRLPATRSRELGGAQRARVVARKARKYSGSIDCGILRAEAREPLGADREHVLGRRPGAAEARGSRSRSAASPRAERCVVGEDQVLGGRRALRAPVATTAGASSSLTPLASRR